MAITITKKIDMMEGRGYVLFGSITVGASDTYTTGGMTINFAPLAKANRTPLVVYFTGTSGFSYVYVPGADAQTGKMKIMQGASGASAPMAEIPAATVPGGVSGDTIVFEARFYGNM